MPQLDKLHGTLTSNTADLLAVCINGSRDQVAGILKSQGMSLPMEASGARIAALYGVDRVPTTLIIDGDRKIVARWEGVREDLMRKGIAIAGNAKY